MEKTELEKKLEAELAAEGDAVEEAAESPSSGTAEDASDMLAAELDQLRKERDDLKDQVLRARAEFDNFRRRNAREMEEIRKRGAEQLLRELLPVVDNLERALGHVEDAENPLAQGVDMVLRQLAGVLQSRGLEPIPAVGEPFDPNFHEALAQQPSDEYGADVVTAEYERGYRIGDFVLRPSKVVVSSGAAGGGATGQDAGNNETQPEYRGEELN